LAKSRVSKNRFPLHGYIGAATIAAAEVLLFTGNQLVGHWFTPIIWTGYILFVDAFVFRIKGRSLLVNDRLEFLAVAIISIASWWLFEFYNAPRFWKSSLELWWHYHNLEPNIWIRRLGYDWAFATITPALLETAELFGTTIFKESKRAQRQLFKPMLIGLAFVGAVGVTLPLVFPNGWLAPVIWLSFIFLLDPLNALRGWPSITGDLARGDWRRILSLLTSGFLCGFLWEFWNYWALAKWTYTVPYFGNIKIFEMPVFGFLGFPPFAIECWAMYIFVRSLLSSARQQTANAEIFLSSKE
jgi:hypothetical protein